MVMGGGGRVRVGRVRGVGGGGKIREGGAVLKRFERECQWERESVL